MKFYYVYILRCADDSLYTWITSNLGKRFDEHCDGKYRNAYTYTRRPLTLVFHEQFTDPNQAIYFEKKFKKWSKKKKEALIAGDYNLLQALSECRNASHYKYRPHDGVNGDKPDIV